MDGFAVQALGGEELERAVGAQHIDRADLRHHVGGDQDHDLVEPRLRADRLRHDLAEAAQQDARTAGSARHELSSRSAPAWPADASSRARDLRREVRRPSGEAVRIVAQALIEPV